MNFEFADLEQRLAKSGAIRLAETEEDDEDGVGGTDSFNVTRIRRGGAGHHRGQVGSDSDSD